MNSKLLAYLQLFRLPNVFTAVADVTMGFLFVHGNLRSWGPFVGLLVATSLLYTAGMVLNDVFDLEVDRRERPTRPLPSGRIDAAWARKLGFLLLAGGLAAGFAAGLLDGLGNPIPRVLWWRGGAVAAAVATCVLLYDGVFKATVIGPLFMASCRFFNVLLGMSIAAPFGDAWHGFVEGQWLTAAGLATYVLGVTIFARKEAETSQRITLGLGWLVMVAGFGLLSRLFRNLPAEIPQQLQNEMSWWLLIGVVGMLISRACLTAIFSPSPQRVQYAVRNCLLSIIFVDAAIASLVAGPAWGMLLVSLIVPTVLLGKWVYST